MRPHLLPSCLLEVTLNTWGAAIDVYGDPHELCRSRISALAQAAGAHHADFPPSCQAAACIPYVHHHLTREESRGPVFT